MNDKAPELRDWLVRTQREQLDTVVKLGQIQERPKIHYTELPEDQRNDSIAADWNFYRQEVGRLLAEGNEGQWILIHNRRIIGIWTTQEEANCVRLDNFLLENVLMKQIQEWEPVLRGGGYNRQWR